MTPIKTDETNLLNDESPSPGTYEKTPPSTDDIAYKEKLLARKLEETKGFADFLDKRQDEINDRVKKLDEREKSLR